MKFKIKNMARISEANIDIKPLTVFIGKNGTNKSYMAHLVYEIYKEINALEESGLFHESKLAQIIIRNYIDNTNFSEDSLDIAVEEIKKKYNRYQIDEDEFEEVEYNVYSISMEKLDEIGLLSDIYNFVISEILKKINKSYNARFNVINYLSLEYELKNIFNIKSISIDVPISSISWVRILFRNLIRKIFTFINQKLDANEFFYFPSSRTGFVLAFDEIVSGIFRDRFGGKPTGTKLTVPTIDFLSNFVDIKTGKFEEKLDFYNFGPETHQKNNIQKEILGYLEKEILNGEIIEDKNEENYIQFSLKTKNDQILDLHLTSTATLELLPIIVFLKHFDTIENKLLVIEEPEAHLHPEAQKKMAQFLILLIKNGARVLITTHSDFILKEFNDHLYAGSNNDELKLLEEDIAIYHFKDLDEKVEVEEFDIDCDQAMPIANLTSIENELIS